MKRLHSLFGLLAAVLLVTSLAACGDTGYAPTTTDKAIAKEAVVAQNNNAAMIARCETSTLVSQEIQALCARAKRINVQNMTSCIALFADNGTLVDYRPVKGKVVSLNSYLLPGDSIWKDWNSYGYAALTTEAPDIDGAYGSNADGVFFFTADTNAYVEWRGNYYWSDQCLKPSTQPLLVRAVSDK